MSAVSQMPALSQSSSVSQTEENSFLLSLKPKETYVCCLSDRRKTMSAVSQLSVVSQLSSVSQTEEELISAVSQTEGKPCLLSL